RPQELTGTLPREYPLKAGEKPPKVRRRIGAAFKLDETLVLRGADPLSALERDLALQLQIAKAARRLCREENISKRLRKRRQTAALLEEQKLKDLENILNQRRLLAGRRSLPAGAGTGAADGLPRPSPPKDWGHGGSGSFPPGAPKPARHPSSCPAWAGWELPTAHGSAKPARPVPPPSRSVSGQAAWERGSGGLRGRAGWWRVPPDPAASPAPRAGDVPPYRFVPIRTLVLCRQAGSSAPSTPEPSGRRGQSQSLRFLPPAGPPAFLYEQDLAPLRYQRLVPSHSRIVRTPSLKDYAPAGGRGLSKAAVTEELKSWHQRARLRGARPHSLDRQGAFRGPRGGTTRDVPVTRG
ncbi:INAVA protein, partial [Ciconia maguari]|nr:INAVA protein [Ciconia maguari]